MRNCCSGTASSARPCPAESFPSSIHSWICLSSLSRRIAFATVARSFGPLRDGILRQVKFVHQSLKRTRRFYGIQILALTVLAEVHSDRDFAGHLPHTRRAFVKPTAL